MSGWDRDAIDLVESGFIEFAKGWEGVDEGDQVSGRPADRVDGQ